MKYKKSEFYKIINDIYEHEAFLKLGECRHHGITRLDHSLRVSYYTYLVTKALHLNYVEATRAALLHDFFTNEVKKVNVFLKVTKHPEIAVNNSKKYFELSEFQEDIIRTHMWPCTLRPPKYLESWIVDSIDDISAIFERGYVTKNSLKTAVSFAFIFIVSKFR